MEKTIEQRIERLRRNIPHSHFIVKRQSESQRAAKTVDYLVRGIDIGYSSFYTYRICFTIYCIIKNNINLSLISPSSFIRTFAEIILQQSINLPEPKYDTHKKYLTSLELDNLT